MERQSMLTDQKNIAKISMLSTDSMKFLSKCQWHIPQNKGKGKEQEQIILKLYGTTKDPKQPKQSRERTAKLEVLYSLYSKYTTKLQ